MPMSLFSGLGAVWADPTIMPIERIAAVVLVVLVVLFVGMGVCVAWSIRR